MQNRVLRRGPLALLFLSAAPAAAQQPPIRLVFDTHCDPVANALPVAQKLAEYETRLDYLEWCLDEVEPYGVQISFLSTGWFMEQVAVEGPLARGAQLMRRVYGLGGQLASHSHFDYRAGYLDWPSYDFGASFAESQQTWQDNIDHVNQAIVTIFAGAPPEPVSDINCVKGAWLPSNEPDYHAMMGLFGMEIRQPGPEEDYFEFYNHHIWHPFRPSSTNDMGEDLSASFVSVTQGSVVGRETVHHGVLQDMSIGAMKRQFLQLYVNWRFRDRHGFPEKIWSWGWGSHPEDFVPGGVEREALVEMVEWLDLHFASRVEPTGSAVMQWSTHRATAAAYFAWEAANPGTSSFSLDSLSVDWEEYPWLRPVAEELRDFDWIEDLSLGGGVNAFRLDKDGDEAILLWRDSGVSAVDLTGELAGDARVVALESGLHLGLNDGPVAVAAEPLLVTEFDRCPEPVAYCASTTNSSGSAARIASLGSTSVAANDLRLVASSCPANVTGLFFYGPDTQQLPFWDGFLCVRAPLVRISPALSTDGAGRAQRLLDLPSLGTPITAGSTWSFQLWFRDVMAGATGANTTDGLNVHFCP